ncbi:MAG TPA: hypothetical protein VIK01_25960 [Polyangiaceae bacterium]
MPWAGRIFCNLLLRIYNGIEYLDGVDLLLVARGRKSKIGGKVRSLDLGAHLQEALGVICFELLTGKLPFQGETLPQLCMAISLTPPTPLRNYRPDLPLEVEAIVLRCLSKDPGKRYATVAALAAELVKFAPRHARLSAERIERLARSAGFSASALALPPSSDSTAASTAVVATTLLRHRIVDFAHDKGLPLGWSRNRSVSCSDMSLASCGGL